MPIKIRHATKERLLEYGPLQKAEMVFIEGENTVYIGDGSQNHLVGKVFYSGGNPTGSGTAGALHINTTTSGIFFSDGFTWIPVGGLVSNLDQIADGSIYRKVKASEVSDGYVIRLFDGVNEITPDYVIDHIDNTTIHHILNDSVTSTSGVWSSDKIYSLLVTTSGDITNLIPSLSGYATEDWTTQYFITPAQLNVVSGNLVAQFPSLSGYATQLWVTNQNYITSSQVNTISGNIIAQIPSLSGYATQSWVGSNYVTYSQHTTASGDIISQIPSLAGYATQIWVGNQGYITPAILTTASGDIIAQIPSTANLVTLDLLNTTSGYLLSQITTYSGSQTDLENVSVNILPEMTGASGNVSTRNIGSPTRKFNTLYAHDVRVDAGSLYVNEKKVIEDVSDTITIRTDPDQDLAVKTYGVGDINLLSEHSVTVRGANGLEFIVPSTHASKSLDFSNSSNFGEISFSATGQYGSITFMAYDLIGIFAEEVLFDGALTVTGTVNSTQGFKISGSAPAGYYLRGDGSNFVSGQIQDVDIPSTLARRSELLSASGVLVSQINTTSGNIVAQIPAPITDYISTAEMTTISGDIIAQIPQDIDNFVTPSELTTTSGDIISQIPSLSGYATEIWVGDQNYIDTTEMTTISGDLVARMGVGNVTSEQLTTTSGDIVGQIPSLVGYATELWTNNNFIDVSGINTISGNIISQIPSLSGYATEGWVGQQGYSTLLQLTTTSGDIISQIPAPITDYVTEEELSTSSGNIVAQIPSLTNYVTATTLNTVSGNIISQMPSLVGYATQDWSNGQFISPLILATTSGNIVDQIPSLSGYATEIWVAAGYIDNTEMTTISGDIVNRIPSIAGYATESWVSTNYIDNSELASTSGNIVSQIPNLVGYATTTWVDQNFIDNNEITAYGTQTWINLNFYNKTQVDTTSGNIVSQIPSLVGYATQDWSTSQFYTQGQINTISGNIVAQIPSLTGYATQAWANTQFYTQAQVTTISGDIISWAASQLTTITGAVIPDSLISNPTMTANDAPSPYVASAKSQYILVEPWMAFDGDPVTYWSNEAEDFPVWIKLDFGSNTPLYGYNFRNSSEYGNESPMSWDLEGSINDVDWNIIHSVANDTNTTNGAWKSTNTYGYSLTPSGSYYRYYRINISESNNVVQATIGEIKYWTVSSGYMISAMFVTPAQLTTTSGDIVAQIPSIAGYATQAWTNSNFVDNSEVSTISGNIVSQIPSLAGYATQSWTNSNFPDNAELTTVSGDIVDQIPSLAGYATQSWVATNYPDNTELTMTSGDIINQIPSTYTDAMVQTTVSGLIALGTQEGIEVTYTPLVGYADAFSKTLTTDTSFASAYGIRQILSAADISVAGNVVRLTITAHSTNASVYSHLCIAERVPNSAGAAGVFGGPRFKEILFNGTPGVSIPAGTSVVSDPLFFEISPGKDYLLTYGMPEAPWYERYTDDGPGIYFKAGADDYNVDIVSGYSFAGTQNRAVTKIEVATLAGINFDALTQLTTTSGDIVSQIPSLSGYATQSWVGTNYIDNSEMTTVSGDIVGQIPSLVEYATEVWVNNGFASDGDLITTSGDIVSQIPSLAGYATETWVGNQEYTTQDYVNTVSGNIVAQIGGAGITLAQLTTTSGDIVAQIGQSASYTTGSGIFTPAGTIITHNLNAWAHFTTITPTVTNDTDAAKIGTHYVVRGVDTDIVYMTGGATASGLSFMWMAQK
jgi:hypothetical protein